MGSVATTENLQKLIPKARWWRIIPPTIIIYIVAYMDRVNIGFAMAGGMNEAWNVGGRRRIGGRNVFLGIPGAADSRRALRRTWQREEVHHLDDHRRGAPSRF